MKQWLSAMLKWDYWMAPAYGIGQSFSFSIWAAFGMAALSRYGMDVSSRTLMVTFLIGGLGTYYYGVRSYEQKVKP